MSTTRHVDEENVYFVQDSLLQPVVQGVQLEEIFATIVGVQSK
jgi:hypothetical protein